MPKKNSLHGSGQSRSNRKTRAFATRTLEVIQTDAADYGALLASIKARIAQSRLRAFRAANEEVINLYWYIGKKLAERRADEGWGESAVERLSRDLRRAYPGVSGFSARNLWDMQRLYNEYKNAPKLRRLVAEIPWGQNLLILARAKGPAERGYYLRATAEMAWTRDVLLNQMKARAYERHILARKQHNFARALPEHLAEQADKAMKDVYMLDFLGIGKPVLEREIERRIVNRIRDVLLEMGCGFAFMGNQYRVSVGTKDYFIDLLFYHRALRCLVGVEIKTGSFVPEHAGKMNFYLNILDERVRRPDENPSIGLILCADRDKVDVEYALRGIHKPVGVAEYRLTKDLPPEMAGKLPDARQIEREVMRELAQVSH
jgi:predicted nuclease of restriction endonuclease-like (RecB) superfamily